ncbi:MAG: AAA family ATPase [Acidimicrobiia bacterium]|nr:AAA family ATPase [Acidimicrobiia bacterium]
MSENLLGRSVRELVERIRPAVLAWPEAEGADGDGVAVGLLTEARRIAAAFVAADGRLNDRQLIAMRLTFGSIDPELANGPLTGLRTSDVITRDAGFISQPSPLFLQLAAYDRTHGTSTAWSYYEAALGVAHAVCALADIPTRDALDTLDRYRAMLLESLRASYIVRPTPPTTTGSESGGMPDGGASGDAAEPDAATWHDPAALGGLPGEEPAVAPTLDGLLDELDELVGLADVKTEVRLIVNLTRVEKMRGNHGLPVPDRSRHLVFVGNPGTGKTTVARLLSRIYGVLGVLARGHLVETDRSGLVAGYVGQTAIRVQEVVTSSLGGTLFIDEAYSLSSGGDRDFGAEAIATLLKLMEDRRDEVVVVVAGYPAPMQQFLGSNPGLRSRFPKTIMFPDYTTDDLVRIFASIGEGQRYVATPEALEAVRGFIDAQERGPTFGNARLARNLFEASVAHHANRVVELGEPDVEELSTLRREDIPAAGVALDTVAADEKGAEPDAAPDAAPDESPAPEHESASAGETPC